MFGSEKPPEVKAGIEDADASGRTALVTGSTSGLGRAAALALGRLGADVIVHGRNREAGETVVADHEAVGSDARFVAADFEKPAEVSALAETVRNEVDDLDVLFVDLLDGDVVVSEQFPFRFRLQGAQAVRLCFAFEIGRASCRERV